MLSRTPLTRVAQLHARAHDAGASKPRNVAVDVALLTALASDASFVNTPVRCGAVARRAPRVVLPDASPTRRARALALTTTLFAEYSQVRPLLDSPLFALTATTTTATRLAAAGGASQSLRGGDALADAGDARRLWRRARRAVASRPALAALHLLALRRRLPAAPRLVRVCTADVRVAHRRRQQTRVGDDVGAAPSGRHLSHRRRPRGAAARRAPRQLSACASVARRRRGAC